MTKVIEVKNLTKKYNKAKTNAVDDISFDVEEGEFFTLLGPNGAGKTTTISILTTTLSKTSGKIIVAGLDLDKYQSQIRRQVGIIFQSPSLDPNLTAEENIRFHALLYGVYPFRPLFMFMPDAYKRKVYHLADILGIRKDLFKPIKTFSGGMKRKLEIIRSLIHNPKILFLDEPTTGLDPVSRKTLWEYLTDIRKKENTTIFLTTHYLEEAEDADKVCIINNGKIVSLGTPNQIKRQLTQNYLILNSTKKDSLRKELERYKFKFEEDGDFKVELGLSSVQQIIKKIDSPLNLLKIHTPSLEEAYFAVIDKDLKNE